jgi:hypothetical protein
MSPVTHVAIGTLRKSPLYKSTGREDDSHFLAYPAGLTVKKALKVFLGQIEQPCKRYFSGGQTHQ